MEVADVAPALQERLGPEATAALVDLFDAARQEWTADVTIAAVERFERRLSDETGGLGRDIASVREDLKGDIAKLRLDMTNEFGKVRQEMAAGDGKLREEMHGGFTALRAEMHGGFTALRADMHGGFTALRQDIATLRQDNATGRLEMLKWCFALWLGQIVAVATIVGVMLRVMPR